MSLPGDVCAMKVMLGLVACVPIQLNCEDLNFTWGTPSISSSGIVGNVRANEVPSLGAELNIWLAAIRLPAPGMFRAIMFGRRDHRRVRAPVTSLSAKVRRERDRKMGWADQGERCVYGLNHCDADQARRKFSCCVLCAILRHPCAWILCQRRCRDRTT